MILTSSLFEDEDDFVFVVEDVSEVDDLAGVVAHRQHGDLVQDVHRAVPQRGNSKLDRATTCCDDASQPWNEVIAHVPYVLSRKLFPGLICSLFHYLNVGVWQCTHALDQLRLSASFPSGVSESSSDELSESDRSSTSDRAPPEIRAERRGTHFFTSC